MKTPDRPANEEERLEALRSCQILDTPSEPTFDALTALAQRLLHVPIALVSLIDRHRQWFKSRQGLEAGETSREISFCGHAVASGQPLLVHDASADERFVDNPLVSGDLHIRFYAGIPLVTSDGLALGTLCVIDHVPRTLTPEQQEILTTLANQAIAHLEKRRETARLTQRLQAVQQAQQAFFEIAVDLLCIANLDWVPQHLNNAWERTLGWSPSQLRTQPLTHWIHPDDVEACRAQIGQLASDSSSIHFRCRFAHRGGGSIPLAWTATVHRGMIYAAAHDLTALELERTALSRSETRLRAIFDAVADGVVIADEAGMIEQVNPAATRMTGFAAEELIGQTFGKLSPQSYVDSITALRGKYLHDGSREIFSAEREGTIVTKAGVTYPVMVSRSEFHDRGVRKVLALIRDISQQKRDQAELVAAKQAAEDANHAKSQFLAQMSHEIRTPLNAVLGYSTLLLDTPLSGEQQQHLQAVTTAGRSLLTQINAILDLSKLEANKLELELSSTDLLLAMEDAVDIVAEQARRKGLALTCILDVDCPQHIECDAGRLRQVLINLANNAVKFTARGEVTIRARRQLREAGEEVRFTVRDTGPGLRSEVLSKLFQPFSQADPSVARRHGGSGLGLSICRRIVAVLGGSIGVDSQVGQGSTFWFALPAQRSEARSDDRSTVPAQLRGRAVLIVDPHEASREQLTCLLSRWGLRAIPCASASAARGVLATSPDLHPAAALIASQLPDASDVDLAQELKGLASPYLQLLVRLLPLGPGSEPRSSPAPVFTAQLVAPYRARRLLRLLQEFGQSPASSPRSPAGLRPAKTDLPAPRILVAEDNPANQRLASLVLQRLGCRVDVVSDGQEALATASLFSFDAILMDQQMPEMDGSEAAQAIRQLPPPACNVPIVALTANASATERTRLLGEGMDDYLTKPLNFDELQKVLQRWLPRHFPGNQLRASADLTLPHLSQETTMELQQDRDNIQKRLQELSALLDADSVADIITMVRADWPRTLRAAEAGLRSGDLTALGREAHYLAGSALQIGAAGLAGTCRELERVAANANTAQATELLGAVGQRVLDLLSSL